MNLGEQLLRKLASWRPESARQTAAVEDDQAGWKVSLTADSVDTIGCRLWEVGLDRTSPLPNPPPLKEQAERIAGRVTGLLEPLRLVEIDPQGDVAQLRSGQPARQGDEVAYYEVLRRRDGTTRLGRFQASATTPGKRDQVPFNLTHEALAKLVGDLAG
jgi:hypothetical protein